MVATGYFRIEGTSSGFDVTEFSGPVDSSYTIQGNYVLFNTVDDQGSNISGSVTSSDLSGTTAFASLVLAVPTTKTTRFTLATSNGTGFGSFGPNNYANITIVRGA